MRMIANSPAAVAAAFSSSARPVSFGERFCAAIPEPMTSAARNALPRYSASSRRESAAVTGLGGHEQLVGELGGQAGGADLLGDGLGVVGDPLDRDLDAPG